MNKKEIHKLIIDRYIRTKKRVNEFIEEKKDRFIAYEIIKKRKERDENRYFLERNESQRFKCYFLPGIFKEKVNAIKDNILKNWSYQNVEGLQLSIFIRKGISVNTSIYGYSHRHEICFNPLKFTYRWIGGLLTFFEHTKAKEKIKECWFIEQDSKGYLKLSHGLLIKDFHAKFNENFTVSADVLENLKNIISPYLLQYCWDEMLGKRMKSKEFISKLQNKSNYYLNESIVEKIVKIIPTPDYEHQRQQLITKINNQRISRIVTAIAERNGERTFTKRPKDWFMFQDSIKAGNCPAGSTQFINSVLIPYYEQEGYLTPSVSNIKQMAIHKSLLLELAGDNYYVKRMLNNRNK